MTYTKEQIDEFKAWLDSLDHVVTDEELREKIRSLSGFVFQPVPYQTGWVCPRCGSVYGPMHSECSRCNPPIKFEVTC